MSGQMLATIAPTDRFEILLGLVAASLGLTLVADRMKLPAANVLIIGGGCLALAPWTPPIEIDPALVLVLFLPPLLIASAFLTVWRDFKAELLPILLMSLGAVAFTTAVTGVVAHWIMPSFPWAACFALGAIVSPPDAVAAKSILERLPLPRRLQTILEGESLLNDASGLVLYRMAVAAALTGGFSMSAAIGSFAWLALGGVAIGVAGGFLFVALLYRIHDPRHVIIVSLLYAWLIYVVAEEARASGVLAIVACGLIFSQRQHELLGSEVRQAFITVWQTIIFLLEALVFVLIGLSLRGVLLRLGGDFAALQVVAPLALATVVAVIAARFLWVYPVVHLSALMGGRMSDKRRPPRGVPLVVAWSGMRGVVSLAAALALPEGFPARDQLIFSTFAVIMVTILLQGGTLERLIRVAALDIAEDREAARRERQHTRRRIAEASLADLEAPVNSAIASDVDHPLVIHYRQRIARLVGGDSDGSTPSDLASAMHLIGIARRELVRLHRVGEIHESTLRELESELDLEEILLRRWSSD